MRKHTDDRLKLYVLVVNEFHLTSKVKTVQALYLTAFTECLINIRLFLLAAFGEKVAYVWNFLQIYSKPFYLSICLIVTVLLPKSKDHHTHLRQFD